MTIRTDVVPFGVLAPPEGLEAVRRVMDSFRLGKIVVELSKYPSQQDPDPLARLEKANPSFILIDASGMEETIETLKMIHAALPAAWILVISDVLEPWIIIEAVREGVREFLPKPLTAEALGKAVARYFKETQQPTEEEKGSIYWITSAKGGSGSTSVAINLSASIAELGGTKVALLDLNHPVGDAATYLNMRPKFGVGNALEAGERLDPVLLESYLSSSHGISILSGSREYRNDQVLKPESLRRLLKVAGRTFSHTLIDLPSVLPPDVLVTMARLSDRIVVTLTPELPALWRTHRLLHLLQEGDCQDRLFLVLNRFDKRSEITQAEIEKTLELPISWTLPNDYRSAIQAINSGQPLVSLNSTPLAHAYNELAQELTGLTPKKSKKGLFSSFFA